MRPPYLSTLSLSVVVPQLDFGSIFIFILAPGTYPHVVGSNTPASGVSSPWFTRLDGLTMNRRMFLLSF